MSETDLSRSIQGALQSIGALVVRVQSGRARGRVGMVRLAREGTPDLWVAYRGREGWLEVKTPRGRLSAAQEAWHACARQQGSRVAVVRSAAEAVEVVTKGWCP